MDVRELVIGLIAASAALVFGLVPGLFRGLTVCVRHASDVFLFGAAAPRRRFPESPDVQAPLGLAVVGALILLMSIAAYLTS